MATNDAPVITRTGVQLPWGWIIGAVVGLLGTGALSLKLVSAATPPAAMEQADQDLREQVKDNASRIKVTESTLVNLSQAVSNIQLQNDLGKQERAEQTAKLDRLLEAVYRMQGERQSTQK